MNEFLFVDADEPREESWGNHAWWTCFDPTCKFKCNVDKAQKAAAKTNAGWQHLAIEYIRNTPTNTLLTADDITAEIGEADSTGAMGAVFKTAQSENLIELAGYKNSTRKTSHGRILRTWRKI